MQITIHQPRELKSEREKLIQEALELIERQERSCLRYRRELQTIRNKIKAITLEIGGVGV